MASIRLGLLRRVAGLGQKAAKWAEGMLPEAGGAAPKPESASVRSKPETLRQLQERVKRAELEMRLERLERERASKSPFRRAVAFADAAIARTTTIVDLFSLKLFVLLAAAFMWYDEKAFTEKATSVLTSVGKTSVTVVTKTTREVLGDLERSLKTMQIERATEKGNERPPVPFAGDGGPKDCNAKIHVDQANLLAKFLFAPDTMTVVLLTGLRGSGKSWTVSELMRTHADAKKAAVINVKLVGIKSVEDIVKAFATAMDVPMPADDSASSLFRSRVVGASTSNASDVKSLWQMLDLLEAVAEEVRKQDRYVVLVVDDINAINVPDGDRQPLVDALDTLVQKFEDWARASKIRTVLVSSDHTIVERVKRLRPGNQWVTTFILNDLTESEAQSFLQDRIAREAISEPGRAAAITKIIDTVGTNLLDLRRVALQLNRGEPWPVGEGAVDAILAKEQHKSLVQMMKAITALKDASGKPLSKDGIVKLVGILHSTFCADARNGAGVDWRVHYDFSLHREYDFLQPLIAQLIASDVLVYYNVGTSTELSLNSKLHRAALDQIHENYRGSASTKLWTKLW